MTLRTRLAQLALPSILLATIAACGTTTRFTATNPSPHPLVPKPAAAVHVYTTGAPEVPYVEVGILQSRQSSSASLHDMPEIIGAMRAEAGKIGCDGVIINGASDKVESNTSVHSDRKGTSYSSSTSTIEGFWGACIVYLAPADEASVAPGATASAAE